MRGTYERHDFFPLDENTLWISPLPSGIHGEPGIKRSKVSKSRPFFLVYLSVLWAMALFQVASADEVVRTMIDHMTNEDNQSHLPLKSGPSSVPDLFKLNFNACRYFIFECNLLCLMQETVWLCVWTTWELCLPWRWLLLLKQPSTLWVTYYLSSTNSQTPSLLCQTRM